MSTVLTIIVSWLLLDAVLIGTWIGFREITARRRQRRDVVVAEIGGQRFIAEHPSLRRSA